MSTARKGFYYKRLKAAGVTFERHYRDYTTDELKDAHDVAVENGLLEAPTDEELAEVEHRARPVTSLEDPPPLPPLPEEGPGPMAARPDPKELAGQRQNTKAPDDVIRVDEQGRQWLQEEVRKPAYPKPRGRRVLRYDDPGTVKKTVKQGDYTETFEVAGDPKNATPSQIKITLPSYQVGMYRDPRYPFKVVCYNGVEGFDRQEVERYYGGAELVDPICKRMYVENVLCYDMRSVIRAINTEFRQQRLAGTIR